MERVTATWTLWLDSSYPTEADSTKPGVKRDSCPTSGGHSAEVEAWHAEAIVEFMNIAWETLNVRTSWF